MKLRRLLIVLAIILSYNSFAQETNGKETPKELMSSYYNEDFNPFQKSNWMVSFNMAFSKDNVENTEYRFESILKGTSKKSNFEIGGSYFFSDNFAGKLGFGIGEERFEGDILKTLDTVSRVSKNRNYSINPSLRTMIPLVPNQRLSLFVDLGLGFGWGNTDLTNTGRFNPTEASMAKDFSFGVGVLGGLTFFAMENFAIEIGLDILSYKYAANTTYDYDEPESKNDSSTIDFSLDLLSLDLALTYYIGSKKNKK